MRVCIHIYIYIMYMCVCRVCMWLCNVPIFMPLQELWKWWAFRSPSGMLRQPHWGIINSFWCTSCLICLVFYLDQIVFLKPEHWPCLRVGVSLTWPFERPPSFNLWPYIPPWQEKKPSLNVSHWLPPVTVYRCMYCISIYIIYLLTTYIMLYRCISIDII